VLNKKVFTEAAHTEAALNEKVLTEAAFTEAVLNKKVFPEAALKEAARNRRFSQKRLSRKQRSQRRSSQERFPRTRRPQGGPHGSSAQPEGNAQQAVFTEAAFLVLEGAALTEEALNRRPLQERSCGGGAPQGGLSRSGSH
jgi:hypothetical protein